MDSKDRRRRKIIYVLLDGIGDLPHPDLNYLTPLEAAYTPNLDRLARLGKMGMVYTVSKDIAPESDIAVFSMLGYRFSEHEYVGRGIIEAIGAGIDVKDGDLALRGNFATIDSKGYIIDRRVGRSLSDAEAKELVKAINDNVKLSDATFDLVHTKGHRVVLRIRSNERLSADISNTDPAYERVKGMGVAKGDGNKLRLVECKALSKDHAALRASMLVNEFTSMAINVLKDHAVNARRRSMGMLEANCILLRDAGDRLPDVNALQSIYGLRFACIVDMPVEQGIAKVTGMHAFNAGNMHDYEIKANTALKALEHYDCVYVHLKGPDEFGHDGDARGKKRSVEDIDRRFFSIINDAIDKDVCIVVTGDHSTPCIKKAHTSDPVPLLIACNGIKDDRLARFTEHNARKGSIGYIMGYEVLNTAIKIIS